MKNWDVFVLIYSFVISIMLFSSGKINYENMLSDLELTTIILAMMKSMGIMILITTFLTFVILFLLIDIIISVIFYIEFPILHFLYNTVYLEVVRGWYWDNYQGSNIFMACIILFGLALISSYINPFKSGKTTIFYKKNRH